MNEKTEWYGPEVKPVYIGTYEVLGCNAPGCNSHYWNGSYWQALRSNIFLVSVPARPWRGLRSPA